MPRVEPADVRAEEGVRAPGVPAAGADEAVALGDAARGGEDEGQRELGGCLGEDTGGARDEDFALGAGFDVDVVEPGGHV